MALQLKQSLSLSQQLIMTPQLQQAIKLLQLSKLELLETINQEMEENPLLDEQLQDDTVEVKQPSEEKESEKAEKDSEEIVEEASVSIDEQKSSIDEHVKESIDWESYLSEYNTSRAETSHESRELPSFENITSSKASLSTHIMWQLNMGNFSKTQTDIGIQIIGNIDKDGYLKSSVEEIAQNTGFSVEEVQETLTLIQGFDPVGVAARDTRECLLIQVKFQNLGGTVVEKIILDHMYNLENKRYNNIAKNLGISLSDVLSAISIITQLEPKPGRQYNDEETIYISPDIYVFKMGDDYEITLNEDGMPKLRINNYYRQILATGDSLSPNTKQYIQDKLKSAAWLIKSIHQRQRTIYKVTESIVHFQKLFFDKGVTYLKPLVLRDVAEHIEMHESTISRVTTNKYVHTPQGIFELKYFFNSSIDGMDGESIASESVKEHIKNIIKSEKKTKPSSDHEIAAILQKLNINIARRTVAKYRESMGIPPSRKRKTHY